ncbi:MAG TPA: alginate lyase family protein [Candidatus Saccharimonadales bacterium]|nr:alginate lyase family protein [Candidatus Saccharimonadales bacterium]
MNTIIFDSIRLLSGFVIWILCFAAVAQTPSLPEAITDPRPQPFVHPGCLHNLDDLDRIKRNVEARVEPWSSAWRAFLKCPLLVTNYAPHPFPAAGRDKGYNPTKDALANDMTAAYYDAIAWYVTGNKAYAEKAVQIMNEWSRTCKVINGSDAMLAAGIYGYKVANAAEIIRYTYKEWKPEDIVRFEAWLKDVWYPVVKNPGDANWGTCCLPTILSIGVFCDDHAIFTSGIELYKNGGNSRALFGLTQYISATGQSNESGRDQIHAQGGVGHLAETAEIAWKQGIDLYSIADNRLLKGLEYMAKYNLGYDDEPYDSAFHRATMGPWGKISAQGRGQFSPVYEMVWNHYVNRRHIPAPYTQTVAHKYRPEPWSVDHPGIGTLTFTLVPDLEAPSPNQPASDLMKK